MNSAYVIVGPYSISPLLTPIVGHGIRFGFFDTRLIQTISRRFIDSQSVGRVACLDSVFLDFSLSCMQVAG